MTNGTVYLSDDQPPGGRGPGPPRAGPGGGPPASGEEGWAVPAPRAGDRQAPKVVVFGATGPTGQRIVSRALEEGYRIVAAARHPGAPRIDRPDVEVVPVDVVDSDA